MLGLQRELSAKYAEVTEFISLTGLRWSELRASRIRGLQEIPFPGLRISRAHFDGYSEKGTKTKNSRTVPLSARAMDIARRHAGVRKPGGYLFVSKMGHQLAGNIFRRYVKWPTTSLGHTIHDLRHYAASSWLRAGIPVHQVARWLGHKNASTLLRIYAHVLGEKQEIAISLAETRGFEPWTPYEVSTLAGRHCAHQGRKHAPLGRSHTPCTASTVPLGSR